MSKIPLSGWSHLPSEVDIELMKNDSFLQAKNIMIMNYRP